MYIKKEAQDLYNKLGEKLSVYLKKYDEDILKQAFHYAYKKHQDQKTLSGEDYIVHLLRSAINLSGMKADFSSIIAGLLHDIIRDTSTQIESIEKRFGKEIATLIAGVTAVSDIEYKDGMTTQDLDFLKYLFKASGRDTRVLLIKICDRIDFLEYIGVLPQEVRKKKAKETLDIYVPLIKVFGIGKYIGNIEDLCYKHLQESEFNRLNKIVSKQRDFLEKKIDFLKNAISDGLAEKNIKSKIEGRIKTIYSISRKLKKKHIPFSGITDLIALRVIVSNKKEAYIVLGILHSGFKCKQNRIKDYISAPKPNGYQSIHTTVVDEDDFAFEVQIQTKQMYKFNMFGLASHTSYKGFKGNRRSFPRWMKKILSEQKKGLSNESFIENIEPNSLKNTIICMTPKGKEIELPKKSTILDFAFKIHSDIGKRSLGAWINDEYVENLVYSLNDGDLVKLKLGENESNYPVRYLSFLKTNIAKKSLKNIFKNKSEKKRKLLGKHLLDERMELLGYKAFGNMSRTIINRAKDHFGIDNKNSLYLEVGSGNIDADKVVNYIYNSENDKNKYTTTVSLKINFKKKDNKNIHLLIDLFHELDVHVINVVYKGMSSYADIHVRDLQTLHELLAEISRLPNVGKVKRKFSYRVWTFLSILSVISLFITVLPIVLFIVAKTYALNEHVYLLNFYTSIALLVFLLFFFKQTVRITLPGLLKQKAFWIGIFVLNTFVLFTVFGQLLGHVDATSFVFSLVVSFFVYFLILVEYLDWKSLNNE